MISQVWSGMYHTRPYSVKLYHNLSFFAILIIVYYTRSYWARLNHTESSRTVLSHTRSYSAILDDPWPCSLYAIQNTQYAIRNWLYSIILDHVESYSIILVHTWTYSAILGNTGPSSAILSHTFHFLPYILMFGLTPFRPYSPIFVHTLPLYSYLAIFVCPILWHIWTYLLAHLRPYMARCGRVKMDEYGWVWKCMAKHGEVWSRIAK